jgi:hypothetical protein
VRRTHGQPLGIVRLRCREQRFKRVISRNDEAGKVGQELATEVEDDEEEIERNEADEGVCLRDAGLLLEAVQGGVFGELHRHHSQSPRV